MKSIYFLPSADCLLLTADGLLTSDSRLLLVTHHSPPPLCLLPSFHNQCIQVWEAESCAVRLDTIDL